jgi:hypothetical protein
MKPQRDSEDKSYEPKSVLEWVKFCKGNGGGVRLCGDPLLWKGGARFLQPRCQGDTEPISALPRCAFLIGTIRALTFQRRLC